MAILDYSHLLSPFSLLLSPPLSSIHLLVLDFPFSIVYLPCLSPVPQL